MSFDGQIELGALRLFVLPEASPTVLYAYPAVPVGTLSLALETTWDLPSLTAGSTANIDVTLPGARRGDFADASLDTSSIAFVLYCHVWSNNSVRVTARHGAERQRVNGGPRRGGAVGSGGKATGAMRQVGQLPRR